MRYLDFEVSIEPAGGGVYEVEARSPQGDATERTEPPASLLAPPETALPPAPPGSDAREVRRTSIAAGVAGRGKALFDRFFTGTVRALLERSRSALAPGEGLRLAIRTAAPEIQAAPWEALADDEPIGADVRSPVVRRPILNVPVDPERAARRPQLRVLVVLASPEGLPALNLELERRRVAEALRWSRLLFATRVRWLANPTVEELRVALGEQWDVLHFAGHGGHDAQGAFLALRAEPGGTAPGGHARLHATELGLLLEAQRHMVVVFLNCCHGADIGPSPAPTMAHEILEARIPAVVGMQGAISDRAALLFAKAVYGALRTGGTLEKAVTSARQALLLQAQGGTREEWIPALFLRHELTLRVPWLPLAAGSGLFLVAAAVAAWAAVPPRFTVTVEDEAGRPLAGAEVALPGTQEVVVTTDEQGVARFHERARRARVRARHARYSGFEGDLATGGAARMCFRSESAFTSPPVPPCYLHPGVPLSVRVGQTEAGLAWSLTVDEKTRDEWQVGGDGLVIDGATRMFGPLFGTATASRRWAMQVTRSDEEESFDLSWWVEQRRPDGGVTSCARKARMKQIVPIEIRSVAECDSACRGRACNRPP
jgi:hypothetical protein